MGKKKDSVFLEEEQRLESEESKITKEYQNYINKARTIEEEIEKLGVVTPSDVVDKKILIQGKNYNKKKAQEYLEYRDSPYFAHLVLDAKLAGETDRKRIDCLIGDELITTADEGPIVIDWRSPMGQTYYQKNLLSFTLEEGKYELLIRRALNIKNATLKAYNTEYISKKEQKSKDVKKPTKDNKPAEVIVDPFLLSVLKDKRREKNATDIISTIQAQQIEIITKDANQSFIVQGCAGSGKTMILLHRLSFLGFHKQLNPNNTRIITPSKFFNRFIDDLSRHLGLDQISRCNIREYYIELIRKYSTTIQIDSNTRSEINLPEKLLKDIYSEAFLHRLRVKYDEYWDDIIIQLEFERINETLEKYLDKKHLTIRSVEGISGKNYSVDIPDKPDSNVHSYRTISLMSRRLERVLQASEQHKQIKEKYEKEAKKQQGIILNYIESGDENRLKVAKIRLQKQKDIIQEESELIPAEIKELKRLRYRLEQLSIEEITDQVLEDALAEVYESEGVILTEKNYQHKLFAMLALCRFYFGQSRIGDRFLNIDEAQDLSWAEYRLLKEVLGPECVFNLYGDTSQNIYPFKGNRTWNQVRKILGGELYNLEQNYRNTMQITEFCNNYFSMDMLPIGISGERVKQTDIRQGIAELQSLKSRNSDLRTVIIKLQGSKKYDKDIMSMVLKDDISFYSLDENKLSIITVEQAKGLEFGAVLVITDGMSTNEKYVSFTRALDNLIVVD